MANTTVEADVLELERQYWQAMKDNDLDTILELTDEPGLVAGAQGVVVLDKALYTKMMDNPSWEIRDFHIGDDIEIRFLNEETAVVAYTIKEELIVDGESVTLNAADTSTWVRRKGRWLCAVHTESMLGDPFGRDRSDPS